MSYSSSSQLVLGWNPMDINIVSKPKILKQASDPKIGSNQDDEPIGTKRLPLRHPTSDKNLLIMIYPPFLCMKVLSISIFLF